MKTLAIIFVAALCAAAGETFLSYGMRRIGEVNWRHPSEWMSWFGSVITSPHIVAGTALLACFFLLYLISLARADLSYVMPLTSFSYIAAAFLAKIYLKEDVTWYRWAGIMVIIVGITLIAMGSSGSRTAGPGGGRPGKGIEKPLEN
ncbi:MAG: EamA family transporter [Nitrospiraceae bacterium]|nr:EamA family transporter [Nitrospiraceae bacterium]